MSGTLRLLMLAICAAGGIGLAVCLALFAGPDIIAQPARPAASAAAAAPSTTAITASMAAPAPSVPAAQNPNAQASTTASGAPAAPALHSDGGDAVCITGVTPRTEPTGVTLWPSDAKLTTPDQATRHPRRSHGSMLREDMFKDPSAASPPRANRAVARGSKDSHVARAQFQGADSTAAVAAEAGLPDPRALAQGGQPQQPASVADQYQGSSSGSADSNSAATGGNFGVAPSPPDSTSSLNQAQGSVPANDPWAAGNPPAAGQPANAPTFNAQPVSAQPGGAPPGDGTTQLPPEESDTQERTAAEPKSPAASPSLRTPRSEIKPSAGEGDHNLTIHIQDTDLREVLDMLSEQGGLNILASNNVEGMVSASLTNVDIDTALAAILKSTGYTARHEGKFIYVGTSKDFQVMTQTTDRVGSRVYRLNYVKASEFQALIVPLLTPGGIGMMSVTPPSQIGIPADVSNTGGDTFSGNETVLVRDYEGVLAQIDQLFQEIDVRPMQVAIEAMILSVELDDKNSFGVDFQALRSNQNVVVGTGQPVSSLGQVSLTNGGLAFGFLDSSLGSFISALETIGDTNVIATPRLTCLNKHRAEILIGTQQGYVNSTSQNLTSTTQAVAFLETGTQLRLRPFISNDGMIRMEIHPESSTGTVTLVGGFTLPNKDVTEVTTNVMVPDGRTVIIGGLMREELDRTSQQIPLLGSAPYIGWLFRHKTETVQRHELIVLITPHIVYEPCAGKEGEAAACDFHRRQAVYQDQMCPVNTRYLGRKYFRIAQNAWAAGDAKSALRFVNKSIHYDPVNRAAIDLQSDIMSGNHSGPYSGGAMAVGPGALDGKEVAPWVLDSLEKPYGPPPPVVHPLEPGRPGRIRSIVRPGGMQ